MTRPDRPRWRLRTWLVASTVFAVLAAALLAVGEKGSVSVILPLAVVLIAIVVTAWTVVRARIRRLQYEARLTSWAADEAAHHERLRIARELHDIVSHGLCMITLRAAAAQRVRGDDREVERDEALADIEQASRDAVAELRRMLAVLRDSDQNGTPLRPVESLADIPTVVAAASAAGLDPHLKIGTLGEVSAGAQATACAIVREAITNTSRYAGPTDIWVDLRRDGEAIIVAVHDDGPRGPWQPTRGAGHGLDGLRERVDALDGVLVAVSDGTGFRVTARLPDGGPR